MVRATGSKACCGEFPSDPEPMTAKAGTLDVTIMGRTYKVACAEQERDALLQAVDYLDAKMNEIKNQGKVASAERIAVMAALNMANELLSQQRAMTPGSAPPDSFDLNETRRRMQSMQTALDEALSVQDRLL